MTLAYETSTQVCSVSFMDDEGKIIERKIVGRSVHSDNIFLFTQEFMRQKSFYISDLDAVIVSNGPGSYTGLRIAASALKGILFQQDVQLYAANTLASFAMEPDSKPGETIHAIIDARRTHVYHQSFTLDKRLKALKEPNVIEIEKLEEKIKPGDIIVGTGINRLDKDKLEGVFLRDDSYITANSLFKLYGLPNFKEFCKLTSVEDLDPNYITSSQINNSDKK
jgi:tRNA threonylcarbamoyl adenosine modification protein YeaZ